MSTNKYLFSVILLLVISCRTPKNVVYFQESNDQENITSSNNSNLLYKIGDELEILVSAPDAETVMPFNKNSQSNTNVSASASNRQTALGSTYIINADGNINFPVLGKLKVINLNQVQVQGLIQERLKVFVNTALVSVRLKNFKITILGEVNSPGLYSISDERITIIEALGLANDMTIKGKRENITVVRESEEGKIYHKIDITSKDIFDSPIYYLKQNDVVYVEPNKAQIQFSQNNKWSRILATIGSILSIALSAVALSR